MSLPRSRVEGEPFHGNHGAATALGPGDFIGDFRLDGLDLCGVADHLHPHREILDESVKRQDRQNGLRGLGRCQIVHPQGTPGCRAAGNVVGGKVEVGQNKDVPVTHRPQRSQNLGVQPVIDSLQHRRALPSSHRNSLPDRKRHRIGRGG